MATLELKTSYNLLKHAILEKSCANPNRPGTPGTPCVPTGTVACVAVGDKPSSKASRRK